MKKHNSLADSPHYRKFVMARDKALEHLHAQAQFELTDIMNKALSDVLHLCAHYFRVHTGEEIHSLDHFESQIKSTMRHAGIQSLVVTNQLLRRTKVLSKASQTEIIAQLNPGKQIQNKIDRHSQFHKPSAQDLHRIYSYMDKLSRKIVSSAQSATLSHDTIEDFLHRVMACFPKRRSVNVPRRVLKPPTPTGLKEANTKPKTDAALDFIDDEQWADMVSTYKAEYIPKWRGPEYILDIPTKGGKEWYAWELERDLTHEFVKAVSSGQIEAANESGITDFVVIAIIDDVTCDRCCGDYGCRDFDGMLVSEVSALTGGEYSVWPYHFNCRCTGAPATENIPDRPDDGSKDFESWLDT